MRVVVSGPQFTLTLIVCADRLSYEVFRQAAEALQFESIKYLHEQKCMRIYECVITDFNTDYLPHSYKHLFATSLPDWAEYTNNHSCQWDKCPFIDN